jgi:hypothetical protein
MKTYESPVTVIYRDLQKALPADYTVVQGQLAGAGHFSSNSPDITVVDRKSNRVFMVQIENVGHYELPYAKVNSIWHIVNENRRLNPEVLLVSTGRVSSAFKRTVEGAHVTVFENQSLNNVVPKLVGSIMRSERRMGERTATPAAAVGAKVRIGGMIGKSTATEVKMGRRTRTPMGKKASGK